MFIISNVEVGTYKKHTIAQIDDLVLSLGVRKKIGKKIIINKVRIEVYR